MQFRPIFGLRMPVAAFGGASAWRHLGCRAIAGLMVRDARLGRAPRHEGLAQHIPPYPEEPAAGGVSKDGPHSNGLCPKSQKMELTSLFCLRNPCRRGIEGAWEFG